MIYARVTGMVSRARAEQRSGSGRAVTVGVAVNAAGEFITVNGVATGTPADELLRFREDESIEVSGPIQPKVHVGPCGSASATFDISIREVPRRRVRRDDRHEERAVADLAPDPLIPHVPATQLALVEPHFDSSLAQRAADASRCGGILRGIADENSPRSGRSTYAAALDHGEHPPTPREWSRMTGGLATKARDSCALPRG
jgi:hypothetical protein